MSAYSIAARCDGVAELREEGLTQQEIGAVIGVSQQTVSADLDYQNQSAQPEKLPP
jgi:predicted transcriptional regulator